MVNPYRDAERYILQQRRKYAQFTATLEGPHALYPLEMVYMGGILKEMPGVRVNLLDAHILKLHASEIDFGGYDWVITNTAPYNRWRCTNTFIGHTLDVITHARRAGAKTVVYGPHMSYSPQLFNDADCVVFGEPEGLIKEAITAPRHQLGPRFVQELDELPLPNFDLLDFSHYKTSADLSFRFNDFGSIGVLSGSRGCPFPCSFCFKPLVSKEPRYHSVGRVLEMVEVLVKEKGCRALWWADLTFTLKRDWFLRLCDGLKRYRVHYYAQTRVDCIDAEIASALKKSGCFKIELGAESGSDTILKSLRKGIKWEDIRRAYELCKDAGVPHVSLFTGFFAPGETKETIRESLSNFRSIGMYNLYPNIWTPYPGTELWQQGVREGKIPSGRDPWEAVLDVAGTVGNDFTREEVYDICSRMSRFSILDVILETYKQNGLKRLAYKAVTKGLQGLSNRLPSNWTWPRV